MLEPSTVPATRTVTLDVLDVEPPIACALSALDTAQRQRRATVAKLLADQFEDVRELADGYAVRLPADSLPLAAEFISLERLCCPFLTFVLEVRHPGRPIWLRLVGPEGVKSFLLGAGLLCPRGGVVA